MLIWTTRFSRKKAVLTVIGVGIIMAILIVLTGRMDSDDVSCAVWEDSSVCSCIGTCRNGGISSRGRDGI